MSDNYIISIDQSTQGTKALLFDGSGRLIRRATGMNLSPYFPASKIAWILEHVEGAGEKAAAGEICHGTIDSWLIYKLTDGKS
ncbi:FGGY family carbohydrate kinase, partial [Dorea sp. D27]|uniref:FGGY family carbohydrate kinase n=1 Tax=Dorea sp. D27 TaxID=658665 RepID=UPI000A6BA935